MGIEADTPEKRKQHTDSDKDLVKKLVTSFKKIWLLVNNFFTETLSKDGHVAFIILWYLL